MKIFEWLSDTYILLNLFKNSKRHPRLYPKTFNISPKIH